MTKKQKSLARLKKDLWKHFSFYIKLRDSEDGIYTKCLCCGKTLLIGTSDCQTGHFYPKGGYPGLRWNEKNCHVQCLRCNVFMEGNTQIYRENLIRKYGEDYVDYLDMVRHQEVKITRSDYIELIEKYKNKVDERRREIG